MCSRLYSNLRKQTSCFAETLLYNMASRSLMEPGGSATNLNNGENGNNIYDYVLRTENKSCR